MKAENCRICKSKALKVILDYGEVALADSFLDGKMDMDTEKKYPLQLCVCEDCKHVQINEIVDPAILFENYPWETGITKSIGEFAVNLYKEIMLRYDLKEGGAINVFEVACNDGSILATFKENGHIVLGVDPAKNIVELARNKGVNAISRFFNVSTAREIVAEYGKWDVCIARNVIAHVKDLHGLAQGLQIVLADDGFAVVECPHALKMLDELQYDQVFHEHIGYHSLDSLQRLFSIYNMVIFDAEKVWMHGGSIRVYIGHKGSHYKVTQNVKNLLKEEVDKEMFELGTWDKFAKAVMQHKEQLVAQLEELKGTGARVAVYGASGKGQSLLQFCGIDKNYVAYVVDRSKMKQGKFTPGTHLPIFSPEHMNEDVPDVVLLCVWNLAKEIMAQQQDYIAHGGKFLHPFPSPHLLP